MAERQFVWDMGLSILLEILQAIWGSPLGKLTPCQEAGTFFGMRVARRNMAVDGLFRKGLYVEAVPLIRASYEDWISLAYILNAEGAERWIEFNSDVVKMDAKVYKGFYALAGPIATKKFFGEPPPEIAQLLHRSSRELRPWGGKTWRKIAAEVGLLEVHDFVYSYLSSLAHGSIKNFGQIFHVTEDKVVKARIPVRNKDHEQKLAWWAFWFHLRVFTLAGCELGHGLEHYSDSFLKSLPLDTLETCVMRREILSRKTERPS